MEIREQPLAWEPKDEQESVRVSGHLSNPGVGRNIFRSPSSFFVKDTVHKFRNAFCHITSPQTIMMSHSRNPWFEPCWVILRI